TGDLNAATVTQGSDSNFSSVNQNGTGNSAVVTQ
ncbi:MAG: curlin, partial [Pseudomonadota bacterium]